MWRSQIDCCDNFKLILLSKPSYLISMRFGEEKKCINEFDKFVVCLIHSWVWEYNIYKWRRICWLHNRILYAADYEMENLSSRGFL